MNTVNIVFSTSQTANILYVSDKVIINKIVFFNNNHKKNLSHLPSPLHPLTKAVGKRYVFTLLVSLFGMAYA